jgi:hypothetical protein
MHVVHFNKKVPCVNIPARSVILYLVNKFKTTGFVLDKKIERRCYALNKGKSDDINLILNRFLP